MSNALPHVTGVGALAILPAAVNTEYLQLAHPTSYGNSSSAEVQCFEFFVRRVVPGLTRVVDERFWHQLIPQLSQADSVIWDAVTALACLIQHPQYSHVVVLPESKRPPVKDEKHRRALKWYSRSIAGLRQRMSTKTTLSASAVVPCILYICIECMQDNLVEAVALYHRAVAMVGMAAEPESGNHLTTLHDGSLENTTRALLRHMSVGQGVAVSPGMATGYSAKDVQSLSVALEELYVLISEAHEFVTHASVIKKSQRKDWIPSGDLVLQQKCLEKDFLKWYSAVETLRLSYGAAWGPDYEERYSVMLVAHGHYFVWLSTCLSMYEEIFDSFLPMFQSMIAHASRTTCIQNKELRPVFTFETRLIPSLFFIAVKCRHPLVRRQAISLLRSGTRIENCWNADAMAQVAERNIGIEESGDEHGVFCLNVQIVEPPCENHRVIWQLVVELEDPQGQQVYYFRFGRWRQDDDLTWTETEHMVKL